MKYIAPPKAFFARNRRAFAAQMRPNTIALFHSNELLSNNADGHYRFVQDSNMYYLSGIDQEEVLLMLFPDAPREEWKEVLFIRKTSKDIQIWEGWKYSKEEARAASGVESVFYYEQFDSILYQVISLVEGIYLDINEQARSRRFTQTAAHRLAQRFRAEFPTHQLLRAAPIVRRQRMLKQPEELIQISKACEITEQAFRRVLKFVQPGVKEYEVEAEIVHEFLRNGATGPAFDTIIASGKNACVLHYVQNHASCKEGEVLLMDFGAEYGHYSADMTRSIPVSGRFSPRQKAVYEAVLRVLRQATQKLLPGTSLEDYQQEVGLLMQEELLLLGLLKQEDIQKAKKNEKPWKKYFMHGTSHHLGLDTHDNADRYLPLQPGMVLTVEPGIYIPEEGLGIRLENDVLVTEDGPKNLMENIPIEVEEIEALMHAG
ncbi:MAG: M24 family metallopeptidase [Bacteroidetes bacterium]|nr:MAG: M24 family metallopeptidase [Bacteroidota bacterium]